MPALHEGSVNRFRMTFSIENGECLFSFLDPFGGGGEQAEGVVADVLNLVLGESCVTEKASRLTRMVESVVHGTPQSDP